MVFEYESYDEMQSIAWPGSDKWHQEFSGIDNINGCGAMVVHTLFLWYANGLTGTFVELQSWYLSG